MIPPLPLRSLCLYAALLGEYKFSTIFILQLKFIHLRISIFKISYFIVLGASTLCFTNPIWVVKTRMCLQYSASSSQTEVYYKGVIGNYSFIASIDTDVPCFIFLSYRLLSPSLHSVPINGVCCHNLSLLTISCSLQHLNHCQCNIFFQRW